MKKAFLVFFLLIYSQFAFAASVKGIYITTSTLLNTQKINSLIKKSKATGINTFVVDFTRSSSKYQKNINLIKKNGIHYVARIVVFPDGGTKPQVESLEYRKNKYKLIQQAIDNGAETIQLDYIRYNTRSGKSRLHAQHINNVIKWFHNKIPQTIPMEVDVFGITSFGPAHHIGQDVQLFAENVDTICPMNYPSHFQPFSVYSSKPRQTVYNALMALKSQFEHEVPVDIIAWIEMSNYHYVYSGVAKQKYIAAQIRAVNDADVTGWYAWSANNKYENLFKVLLTKQDKSYSGE